MPDHGLPQVQEQPQVFPTDGGGVIVAVGAAGADLITVRVGLEATGAGTTAGASEVGAAGASAASVAVARSTRAFVGGFPPFSRREGMKEAERRTTLQFSDSLTVPYQSSLDIDHLLLCST